MMPPSKSVKPALAAGFTLIEIAIVLVIIGLIVGGVLVGQDLIRAAGARSVLTDIDRFNAAANTFLGKYNCVPGDCANATTFWPQDANCGGYGSLTTPATATCNGNGDGVIETVGFNSQGTVQSAPYYYKPEDFLFWQHLALAGLISGVYSGVAANGSVEGGQPGVNVPNTHLSGGCYQMMWTPDPAGGFGSHLMFQPFPSWNAYVVGTTIDPNDGSSPWSCFQPLMSPSQALGIDAKIDDGMPSTGNVQTTATLGSGPNPCFTYTNPALSSSESATNTYNTSLSGPQCGLVIRTQF